MAFSAQLILEVVILFSFLVTTVFMFFPKEEKTVHKIFFALSLMLGVLVTTVSATSVAPTMRPQIIMAWLGLVPSAIAVIVAVAKNRPTTLTKLFAMATTLYGALVYLFLI